MLGAQHLGGARAMVDGKIRTSIFREEVSSEDGDSLEDDEDMDVFAHEVGRKARRNAAAGADDEPALLGGANPGWQYDMPTTADLLGWRVMITFPTGGTGRSVRKWHEGFIVECKQYGTESRYRVYFSIDEMGEWLKGSDLPDTGVCFRRPDMPTPKVPPAELARAKKRVADDTDGV